MQEIPRRKIQLKLPAPHNQKCRTGDKADALGKHRGQRRAARAHIHKQNEHDIQHKVQQCGDADKEERMFGIAHAAQNSADDVIAIDERKAYH